MSIPISSTACAIGMMFMAIPSDALAVAAQAATHDRPAVIELFTSQGCSSCPPADTLLGHYAKRDGVIALSFHVDYWDRLGWRDRFASADFSQRQRQYARARGDAAVYTPQVVVTGAATSSDRLIRTLRPPRRDAGLGGPRPRPGRRYAVELDIRVEPAKPLLIDVISSSLSCSPPRR